MSRGRKPQRKTPTVRWEKVGQDLWMINIYSYDHHELNKAVTISRTSLKDLITF